MNFKRSFAACAVIWATMLLTGALSTRLCAGAEGLVRIGIICQTPAFSHLEDLLTVNLSQRSDLAVLEREHIHRLLSEQTSLMSRAGEFVKLGEILGADGLLVLEKFERDDQSFVGARLVAVKPGVVLDFSEYQLPIQGETDWSRLLVERLGPLFPKLAVLPKDAVPISILGLRSAMKTPEAEALERNLNGLLLRRLMRQKEVFVLERSKLQLAAEEKSYKGLADSEFWNGSYLLEGTLDRGGYKPDVLTINLRVNPPAPGKPMEFEIVEQRSDLGAAIEKLAAQLLGVLRPEITLTEWSAKAEAARFFEEARWSSRWGLLPEALAASDSAWVLGRRDSNCAVMRVEFASRLAMTIPPSYGGQRMFDPVRRVYVLLAPDPGRIGFALRSLAAYREFSGTLPANEPRQGSEWGFQGVRALESASHALQLFHHFPDAQPAIADKLAELRALAREVAGWMLRSPSVRETYWASRRVAGANDYLELGIPNIFRCSLNYGWLWRDHPEETIALYRELMTSPVFFSIHQELCVRAPESPRLALWNEHDRTRVSSIWEGFLNELTASTNLHYRLEAQFLRLVDEPTESERTKILNSLFTNVCELEPILLSNNASLLAMQRGAEGLTPGPGWPNDKREWLGRPWAERARRLRAIEDAGNFEAQKHYLQTNAPYQPFEFAVMLNHLSSYTKAQAAELAPLVQNYWSNLLATAASRKGHAGWTNSALQDLRQLEYRIGLGLGINPNELSTTMLDAMLAGGAAKPPGVSPQAVSFARTSPPPAKLAQTTAPIPTNSLNSTNRIAAVPSPSRYAALPKMAGTRFHPIPQSQLKEAGVSSLVLNAHRLSDSRLWLDLRYGRYPYDWRTAIAVWDPGNDTWEFIPYPTKRENPQSPSPSSNAAREVDGGLYFETFQGALYVSQRNEPLRKFDLKTRRWETMPIPVVKPTQLFAIHGRLYGASEEAIFEILPGGQTTRLLAASRRRPPASRLDSLYSFDGITLLPGPAKSIRACLGQNVFPWSGDDWAEPLTIHSAERPIVSADGTLFRSVGKLWLLPHDRTEAQLCAQQEQGVEAAYSIRPQTAVGILNSNLYFVSPHTANSNMIADIACLDLVSRKTTSIQVQLGENFGAYTDGPPRPFGNLAHLRPWVEFVGDTMILGQGRWSGIWTISRRSLEAVLIAENERRRKR